MKLDISGQWGVYLPTNQDCHAPLLDNNSISFIPFTLPGSLNSNGLGNDVSLDTQWTVDRKTEPMFKRFLTEERFEPFRSPENFKFPYWFIPDKYYVGEAYYRRTIRIPDSWAGHDIRLILERPHGTTSVIIDGKQVARQYSLSAPLTFDLSHHLSPGHSYDLILCVDNRISIPIGKGAHSVTDHSQTNWNGIIGQMALEALPPLHISAIRISTDAAKSKAGINITLSTPPAITGNTTLEITISDNSAPDIIYYNNKIALKAENCGEGIVNIDAHLGAETPYWDEHSPNLLRLSATLSCGNLTHTKTATFGLIDFEVNGTQFCANGKPAFLRGTIDCCVFPKDGFPPTDLESWKYVFRQCKAHGINHMRFHSWCPPEAAFSAADEIGIYLQPESPVWGMSVGDDLQLNDFIYSETMRILEAYGNHPSFRMMAHGNEPWGKNKRDFLSKWVKYWKERYPDKLFTTAAHHPLSPQSDYHIPGCIEGFWIRSHTCLEEKPSNTLRTYSDQIAPHSIPCVAHEGGQWCSFPNIDERAKYDGSIHATVLDITETLMEKNGILELADDFCSASSAFQALLYKEEIEAYLRTPGLGGFQLLGLNDFPGQGYSPVGILDAFYDEKGHLSPSKFRQFCSEVVPLAAISKLVWLADECFMADISIFNFSRQTIPQAIIEWDISTADGNILSNGNFAPTDIRQGCLQKSGHISFGLENIAASCKLLLTLKIADTPYTNQWEFFVFSSEITSDEGNIKIHRDINAAAIDLDKGESVLLSPDLETIPRETNTFEPIFWNNALFPNQKANSLGIFCNPQHPALQSFPTDNHSSWQWQDLVQQSKSLNMSSLGLDANPIIQLIDDWQSCRRLGLIFEARAGRGRLLVSMIDLITDINNRPEARQLRASLIEYMQSEQFNPVGELELSSLKNVLSTPPKTRRVRELVLSADSELSSHPVVNIIDRNPATVWQSEPKGYPHCICFDIGEITSIMGFGYLPCQADDRNGMIDTYRISVSHDGREWVTAIEDSFSASHDYQEVIFDECILGKYLKFEMLSPQNKSDRHAVVSRFRVINF